MKTAIELITEERQNQIRHGFTAAHDDAHRDGELAIVAAIVSRVAFNKVNGDTISELNPPSWPWSQRDYERITRHEPARLIAIAAALLVAELERLQRQSK